MTAIHPIRLMLGVLPDHPHFGESVAFQINGLLVVFVALGAIWGVLEIIGELFRIIAAHQAAALERKAPPALPPAPVVTVATAVPPPAPALTYALIAATVDTFAHGRVRIVSVEPDPQLVRALIAATVHCMFEGKARIVAVNTAHPDTSWAREGRRDIFSSHRVR
jgi:hypothetical protein